MTLRKLKDIDMDDFLGVIGLERKASLPRWLLETLGLFGLGVAVGAGVALLMAPKSGRELRDDIRHQVRRVTRSDHDKEVVTRTEH